MPYICAMEISPSGIKFRWLASGDVMAATHGPDHRKCQLLQAGERLQESDSRVEGQRRETRIERRMAPEMTIVGDGAGVVTVNKITGSRRTEFEEQTSERAARWRGAAATLMRSSGGDGY
ncbi:hypothetical protein U1Q18_036293 [Sarracenia purpurea var. burkii]